MPRFSVLVPVYNGELHIKKCLESLLEQTFEDFEVILLNDGSSDRSGEIADEFALNDKRIHVFFQKNQGIFRTRISMMQQAAGEYLVFCDADDWMEKNALEKLDKAIQESNAELILFDSNKVYTEKGKEKIVPDTPIGECAGFLDKEFIAQRLSESFVMNPLWRKTVRRRIVDPKRYHKYLDICQGEDLIIGLPWLFEAGKVFYLKESLYYYRCGEPQSATGRVFPYRFRMVNETRKILLEYLKQYPENVNMEILANHYFLALNYCMADIVFGIKSGREKNAAFEEMKASVVYKSLKNYVRTESMRVRFRLSTRLLIRGHYRALSIFCRFVGIMHRRKR